MTIHTIIQAKAFIKCSLAPRAGIGFPRFPYYKVLKYIKIRYKEPGALAPIIFFDQEGVGWDRTGQEPIIHILKKFVHGSFV